MTFAPGSAFAGVYFDGRSAGRHAVTVTAYAGSLAIAKADGSTLWWPLHEVRQTAGSQPGEPVRLERGEPLPEMLEVADPRFGEVLRALHPGARLGGAPLRRGFRWKLAALAAGAAFVLVAAYLWLLPAVGVAAAAVVPESFEERMGQAVIDQLVPERERCSPEEVTAVFERLRAALPQSPYTFRVLVANEPMVNALAAPGGSIVVFRGLLERTGSPEELAAVLAHEAEHVIQRHSTRALMRDLTWRAVLALIAGDSQGVLAGLAGALGELHYRRQDEEAADRGALRTLQRARVDPAGLLRLFRTLEKESSEAPAVMRYLSTHPSLRERLARMEELIARESYQPVPLLEGQPWPPRDVCRGR